DARATSMQRRRANFPCRNLANTILSRQRIRRSGNLQHKCVMAEPRYNVTPLNRYNGESSGGQPAETTRFQTFEDLEVCQAAREFRKAMYAISRRLPEFDE